MKKTRIVMTIAIILTASLLLCGCMQHGHFEFEINEFTGIETSNYTTESTLDKYKVLGVVVRPWIYESPHDEYNIGIRGYTNVVDSEIILEILSIYLYDESGEELISLPNFAKSIHKEPNTTDEEFYMFVRNESESCFFAGCPEIINSYGNLTLKLNVEIIKGDESEFRELTYEFNVVEYLTTTLPMPT